MRQFNKESQQALDWSIEIAKEKLEKSDGVDKVGVDILVVCSGEYILDTSIISKITNGSWSQYLHFLNLLS